MVERSNAKSKTPSVPDWQALIGLLIYPGSSLVSDLPLRSTLIPISSAELAFGAPLALPAKFLSSPEPPPLQFVEKLCQADPPPTRPLTYAAPAAAPSPVLWRPNLSTFAVAALFHPWSRFTWVPTRLWIMGPRSSPSPLVIGKRRCLWTALSQILALPLSLLHRRRPAAKTALPSSSAVSPTLDESGGG